MDFGQVQLDAEQQAFLDDVHAFVSEHVTDDVLEEERRTGSGFNERVHLALGAKGWIMPAWPAERGGAGLDPVRVKLLDLVTRRSGMPTVTLGTTRLVVKAVERHAEPGLAADVLPGIAAGTVRCCLGYTEPDGGSDIAAAKTRAVSDGDEWVINGSKIFTTGAQNCQYAFLITRTDPELPKHCGLTMFLVPLGSDGVEIQGIRTFGGERTNIVYYSDVRISDRYRLGGVNDGWTVLRGPLDEEHSFGQKGSAVQIGDGSLGATYVHPLQRALDSALAWACTTTRPDGSRPIDDRSVRYRLGQVAMDMQAGLMTPGPMGRVEVFRQMIAQHVLGLPRPAYLGSKVLVSNFR